MGCSVTAPRPEAVRIAANCVNPFRSLIAPEYVQAYVESMIAEIDAALTAAREEQREKDAAVIDKIAGREHGRDQSIMLLCARAIREGR